MNAPATGGVSVLHVKDDPTFADRSGDMLGMVAEDITVTTAPDAGVALRGRDEEPTDCVVSDYDRPGRSGLELLESVRERCPDLPSTLFTGKGSEEIASRAIGAGISDYLQKASGKDCYEMLAKRVRDAVERYRSEKRYHSPTDTAPVPIILFDPHRRLQCANDAAVEFPEADRVEPPRDADARVRPPQGPGTGGEPVRGTGRAGRRPDLP
jgi:Response regulator containing CheY-like receiver, AAA-type ATPase, and DNA-binding domains